MVAPCSGALSAAVFCTVPLRADVLGYTGSCAFMRALQALFKATLMCAEGATAAAASSAAAAASSAAAAASSAAAAASSSASPSRQSDELLEKLLEELFAAYKKLADPSRLKGVDESDEPLGELTITDDDDPKEVMQHTGLLSLPAAGLFQVPARGPHVAGTWPAGGSWRLKKRRCG